MKIIINEEQLRKLLIEKLGVADNLLDSADILRDRIIDFLSDASKKMKNKIHNSGNLNFTFESNFQIGQHFIKTIDATIGCELTDQTKKIAIYNLSVSTKGYLTKQFKYSSKSNNSDNMDLIITIAIPTPSFTLTEVHDFFVNNKDEIGSVLSHELGHVYERNMNPGTNISTMSKYQGAQSVRLGVRPIDDFLFYIYYTSVIENIARPPEVAYFVRNINKSDFNEFRQSNQSYVMLRKIKNFSYENLKKELLNHIPRINEFLKSININVSKISDESKINKILESTYIGLSNADMDTFQRILSLNIPNQTILENLLDFAKKSFVFEKHRKEITKFQNNYEKYFLFQEKKLNFVADKMIRKLDKLFDMAKDNKEDKKNIFQNTTLDENSNSILDWELYGKIKKIKNPDMSKIKSREDCQKTLYERIKKKNKK